MVTVSTLLLSWAAAEAADPYDVISKKNLFRPDRQEWILDKPDATMVDKKVDISKLELYGTIIVGDKKNALIFDKDTDKKGAPKGKRQEARERSVRKPNCMPWETISGGTSFRQSKRNG